MKTSQFLDLLKNHQGKSLLFQYAPGLMVEANYHITEVKHIKIDSVDCGSGTDSWNETIIQLWESPSEIGKTAYMSAYKALGILKKVGQMKPYDLDATARIEYGNARFHTAQWHITDYEVKDSNLIINLSVNPTDCKAKETCGVTVESDTEHSACCAPESGCC